MAECHPVGFQWVMEAKARGATVIHVDPRFTRTSARGRPARAAPRRHRHRVPRRDHQLRARATSSTSTSTSSPTPTRRRSSARTSGTPRTSTACSPASTPSTGYYDTDSLAVRGRGGAGRRRRARPGVRATGAPATHGAAGRPRRVARLRRRRAAHGEPRARRDAAAPALRLPGAQAALRPLHARDGRGGLRRARRTCSRRSASALTENSGRERTTAFVYAVGWTQHTVGVQYIRTAAILQLLLGNIGRPGGGIMALRGHASHPGLHRHPDAVRPAARLHPDAARARARGPRQLRRGRAAQKGYWAQHARLPGQPAEGVVGRRGDGGERLLLRLPAAAHRQPQHLRDRAWPSSTATCKGYFLIGENPAVGSANARMQRLGHGEARLAGRARLLADRERHLVEGRPGDRDRRAAHRGHRHRGVLPARRRAHREGRQLHQHPAHAAVAPQGGRARPATPQRAVVHLPPRPRGSGRSWPARPTTTRPAAARPDLGLPDVEGRSPSRTPRRCSPRSTAADADGAAAVGLHRAEGRRLDRVRLLDLLRRLRRRRQPGRPAQARQRAELGRRPSGAGRGRPTGASSTTGPRPTRTASRGASARRYVWWDAEQRQVDRPRRARLRADKRAATTGRPRAPPARTRSPATTRSSCRPTARAGCSRRPGSSTGRCRRTTSRRSRRSPTRSTRQQRNPARQLIARTATTATTRAATQPGADVFPYVAHHLPADRAPHRRRDEPLAAVPGRAAAGVLLRGLARAGRRARARAPRLGDDRHRAQRDRGAGAGDRADAAAQRRGPDASTRSACPTTGARTATRTGDAANELPRSSLDPNVHIQEVKALDLRHPARPPAARAGAARARRGVPARGPGSPTRPGRSCDDDRPTRAAGDRRRRSGRRAGHADHPPRMGFFTDTTVCIGCKACEVACKEWNDVPEDGLTLHRHVLRQHRRARRRHLAARRVHRAARRRATHGDAGDGATVRWLMASRRVQALHPRRLPRRLPDRRAVPHRVRHRRRPGGHLQRLRLLRPGLPVRGDRPAPGRRPGLEVHAVLRPARRRPGAGVRQGLPDRVDPVRRARRAARAGRAAGRASCTTPASPSARLYGARPGRRRRRRRRVLPAARRARGLRPAARPGRDHARPAARCGGTRGARGRRPAPARSRGVRGRAA